MRIAWLSLCCVVLLACGARVGGVYLEPSPPPRLEPFVTSSDAASTEPATDPNAPALDLLVTKSMLYAAGLKHGVNPYLVMGLAWWESGWNESAISSAGAIGIMQVMPATAEADGPVLLHRQVNLNDPADNIDMGTAILRADLDRYHGDLAKALVAYYAGGGAVTDWAKLTADERHYAWGVYRMAIAFRDGKGPV
jgi:soluble lytic murein transglycosylase-like protein